MAAITLYQWVIFSVVMGLFWGIIAMFIYSPQSEMKWNPTWYAWENFRNIAIFINQISFNFVGGFSGASCLGLLWNRVQQNVFGSTELVLLVFSILGLSGKLSAIIWELPDAISKFLASQALKKE